MRQRESRGQGANLRVLGLPGVNRGPKASTGLAVSLALDYANNCLHHPPSVRVTRRWNRKLKEALHVRCSDHQRQTDCRFGA